MDTAQSIARSLHLAFKGMDSGEVYDILMQQFLVAAAKYDPDYTKKIKLVAECIDHELSKYKQSVLLTPTGTWSLIAIAICASLLAVVFSRRSKERTERYPDGYDLNNGRRRSSSSRADRSDLRITFRPGSGTTFSNGLRNDSLNWKRKKGYTRMGSAAGKYRKDTSCGPATSMVLSYVKNPKKWPSLVAAVAGLLLPVASRQRASQPAARRRQTEHRMGRSYGRSLFSGISAGMSTTASSTLDSISN